MRGKKKEEERVKREGRSMGVMEDIKNKKERIKRQEEKDGDGGREI